MLRHRKATKSDVSFVMKNLSNVSAKELQFAGYSVAQAKETMIGEMKNSESIAFLDRAEPMAVLIFMEEALHEYTTMFMATEKFFGGSWRASLYLRRFLDGRFASNPRLVVRSQTFSDHEQLHRWYQIMGYEGGIKNLDGLSTSFVRRASASGT